MKVYFIFSILLIVFFTIFTKNIVKKREGVKLKLKRAETSDECKYINSILGKKESYNCCEDSVKCENGHITKKYKKIFFFF